MFQILSQAYIRRWLMGLIHRGSPAYGRAIREGPTLKSIAHYTGISADSLRWMAYKDTARFGREKIRTLSKMIAEIENGILDFKRAPAMSRNSKTGLSNRKIAVRYDKPEDRPKVKQKYRVAIGAKSPKLSPVDRPGLPGKMPTMKDLLGK